MSITNTWKIGLKPFWSYDFNWIIRSPLFHLKLSSIVGWTTTTTLWQFFRLKVSSLRRTTLWWSRPTGSSPSNRHTGTNSLKIWIQTIQKLEPVWSYRRRTKANSSIAVEMTVWNVLVEKFWVLFCKLNWHDFIWENYFSLLWNVWMHFRKQTLQQFYPVSLPKMFQTTCLTCGLMFWPYIKWVSLGLVRLD